MIAIFCLGAMYEALASHSKIVPNSLQGHYLLDHSHGYNARATSGGIPNDQRWKLCASFPIAVPFRHLLTPSTVLSTSACFLEIFEVGFGLCAICLPTLSGALRLQAMQPIVKGFNSLVSNISRVSLRSGSSRNKEEALHRKDSESDSSQHRAATQETAKTKRHDIEMGREDVPLDTFVR